MPRRNNRINFEPVDYTPADAPVPPRRPGEPAPTITHAMIAERKRERWERQERARINGGIDWSACLVPGCGNDIRIFGRSKPPKWRNHKVSLPLCLDHLMVAYDQARPSTPDPLLIAALAELRERKEAHQQDLHEAAKKAWLQKTDGEMYFVRLNGLIKVGWTRSLPARLKSYGASAELLLCYPATRDDETNLHRQLRPVLAKGREWYTDGPIIQHFIDEALAKYGQPREFEFLWTQPKQVVAGKRHPRSA